MAIIATCEISDACAGPVKGQRHVPRIREKRCLMPTIHNDLHLHAGAEIELLSVLGLVGGVARPYQLHTGATGKLLQRLAFGTKPAPCSARHRVLVRHLSGHGGCCDWCKVRGPARDAQLLARGEGLG